MSRTITVDGTDVTALTRVESWALQMKAHAGEVAAGSVVFDDATGTADPAAAMKEWVVTESLASPTTIAGGFIGERKPERGPLRVGAQRQWEPVLEDYNAAFTDRVLKTAGARRPAETDVARITWLAATGALGMLDAFTVSATDPEDMERTNYRGKYPFDVLNDCAENAGKNFFVYYKAGTGWTGFYGPWNQTTAEFTSSIRISDVAADVDDVVTFGARAEYELDPGRIYSTLFVRWRKGWVTVTDAATVTNYRNRQKTVIRENIRTAARARRWANVQLAKLNEEVKRLTLTVQVPASSLGEVRAGQRIQVKQQHAGITAFTYFRIVDATYRWATDNSYYADLVMRDKIRPVNIGDIHADPESTVAAEGSGSGGIGNDDPKADADVYDPNPLVVDDFERTPPIVDTAVTASAGTSHEIALPDGVIPGRLLLIFLAHTDNSESVAASLVANHGLYQLTGLTLEQDFGTDTSAVVGRVIQGDELWAQTGQTLAVTTTGSVSLHTFAVLLDGNYRTAADPDEVLGNSAAAAAPGVVGLAANGWTGDDAYVLTFGVSDTSISGEPTGYTNLASGSAGGLFWRASAKGHFVVAADETPSAYTAAGDVASIAMAVRGEANGSMRLGRLPIPDESAWWEGGNLYDVDLGTIDDWGIASGYLFVENDSVDGSASFRLHETDGPLPFMAPSWEVLIRFRATTAGSVVDAGTREVTFEWSDTNKLTIQLGDTTLAQGVRLRGAGGSDDYLAKTVVGAWYLARWEFSEDVSRARVWLESATEHATWDVEATPFESAIDWDWDVHMVLGNNGGTAQRFEVDYITTKVPAESGQRVQGQRVATGDGTTVAYALSDAYSAGSLVVTVDGIIVVPASQDADAGTFTLDSAPSSGAVIAASWTVA